MNSQQLEILHNSLKVLLPQLKEGQIECIEYGIGKDDIHSSMSYLKVRYIQTAGGMQFALRTVYGGVEGSGYYTSDMEELLSQACSQVIYFHRPTPLKKQLERFRAINDPESQVARMEYSWYPTSTRPSKYHEAALERELPGRLGDVKTITLS